jgi:hypothetical protein
MKYLNIKTVYGVETIDELDRKDFATYRAFRCELLRLIGEYRLAGMDVYVSQRPCKAWDN